MVETWNQTRVEYDRAAPFHRVFAKRAAEMPEHTAVVFEDQALSYAELECRANQLAHFLRDRVF